MGVKETTKNFLGNIFTDSKSDVITRDITVEVGGYVAGELLTYDNATGLYKRAIAEGATTPCDAILYDDVLGGSDKGIIVVSGGVRGSLLFGYATTGDETKSFELFDDEDKFRIIGELADKNLIIG